MSNERPLRKTFNVPTTRVINSGLNRQARNLTLLLLCCSAVCSGLRAADESYSLTGMNSKHLNTLTRYCGKCHNSEEARGRFRIDELRLTIESSGDADRWQKVLNALNGGEMPPKDEEQIPGPIKTNLADDLGTAMVALRSKMSDRHGEIAMSRLNRREYRNTLRELLGVEINVSQLPSDDGLSNFDTNGASLYVSSNQLESYLELGREAVEEAIDQYHARSVEITHRHEAESLTEKYRAHFAKWDASRAWRSALAEEGLKAEHKEIYDALKKKYPRHQDKYLPFYLYYNQIANAPPIPKDPAFRFFDNPARVNQFIDSSAPSHYYLIRYLKLPSIDTGAFITVPTIHPNQLPTGYIEYNMPPNWPPGKYKVRFRAARVDDAPDDRRFLEFGLRVRNVDLLSVHEVTGTMDNPQIIETSIDLTRKHTLGEHRDERQIYLREKGMHHQFHYPRKIFQEAKKRNGYGPEYVFWIDWLEVERVTTADQTVPAGLQAVAHMLGDDVERPEPGLFVHQTRGVNGRKIRILNPDTGGDDYVHFREIRVISGGKNIASAGTASQSSTHGNDRTADRAIDGDLKTINHTANKAQPGEWWELDFGHDVTIDEIQIFNRNDSPNIEARLQNYSVTVTDSNDQIVWDNNFTPGDLSGGLADFCTAAFRGEQPDEQLINRLVAYYNDKRELDGFKHREALTQTLSVVLSSPMFLYKSESSLKSRQTISDQELAHRLSYFLWSAPADNQLMKLAAEGQLSDPQILREQTNRLLDDARSREMIHGLIHQWLDMKRLDFFNVNIVKHRRYDNSVKLAVRQEVYETTAYLLAENHSIADLLKADYVIINNLLAHYYGIPDVDGDHFRRVKLPKDSPRGGLLGMAAIHLMGGNGDESSPVERGAWVLRKLLNQPPPPAPANVPNLSRLSDRMLTTRERLAVHQELPQCASCHRKIDPIGLGMENFDAVGLWRTKNSYEPPDAESDKTPGKTWNIDAGGRFHDGAEFADYFELRDHIAGHRDDFARSFSAAVLEYGMGRALGFSDQSLIEDIAKQAKDKDYAMRSFIHALVQHPAFRRK